MTPEEFRRYGHRLVDRIADYRATVEELPVRSRTEPGAIKAQLPKDPPLEPEPFDAILADVERVVLPGLSHWQHPRFFGYFPSNGELSAVLGDLLSTGLGVLGLAWQSSPALTEVEEVATDWLRRMLGLSDGWSGVIQDTASTSTLLALLCARERASKFSLAHGGLHACERPLVVYASEHAHSSVDKAALLAGFGRDNLRKIPVDARYAMRADLLERAVDEDRAAGKLPCAIVATSGTTTTAAFDPIEAIARIARASAPIAGDAREPAAASRVPASAPREPGSTPREPAPVPHEHDLWLHVDAAMAGSAMILPECRALWRGIEQADSLVLNPHKWLGASFDCSAYYVRDPEHLVRVMSTSPSYLRTAVDEKVKNLRDWGIPLGRRFRALKLWFLIREQGVVGLQRRLRRDLENAKWLEKEVRATKGWRVLAPVELQTLCVRHEPPVEKEAEGAGRALDGESLDRHTLAWAESINASGDAYLTPALLDGRWMVRVSIGALATERAHVAALWERMRAAAEASTSAR